jgi:hypothetical protein
MIRYSGPQRMVYDYPLREGFLAQVVLPRDLTTAEAARLYAFIKALALPDSPTAAEEQGERK